MKILEVLERILSSASERFEGRTDNRGSYDLFLGLYNTPDKNGAYHPLDEIRTMMERHGLEFDPLLFEGGRENG
ncbi:MAG: hypothetical protein K2O11_01430 [Oscillospiraceae bacterium]|nr:hypothetical protein [Oscillospiraceae bacterium]